MNQEGSDKYWIYIYKGGEGCDNVESIVVDIPDRDEFEKLRTGKNGLVAIQAHRGTKLLYTWELADSSGLVVLYPATDSDWDQRLAEAKSKPWVPPPADSTFRDDPNSEIAKRRAFFSH